LLSLLLLFSWTWPIEAPDVPNLMSIFCCLGHTTDVLGPKSCVTFHTMLMVNSDKLFAIYSTPKVDHLLLAMCGCLFHTFKRRWPLYLEAIFTINISETNITPSWKYETHKKDLWTCMYYLMRNVNVYVCTFIF
jgi:hypothetical protein